VLADSPTGWTATFLAPSLAVLAARAILVEHSLTSEADGLVGVAAGISTAEMAEQTGAEVGLPCLRARQLASLAEAEQILADSATREVATGTIENDHGFLEFGAQLLDGIESPTRVWQVTHPQLRRAFREMRSAETRHNNLPARINSFVGRTDEIADLHQILAEARWLTIVGGAGIGKSSLAIRVAMEVVEEHPDGVWYIDLREYSPTQTIESILAQAFKIRVSPGWTDTEALAVGMGGWQALVLLDNASRHANQISDRISGLLKLAPGVQWVAASRRRFRNSPHHEYLVAPLKLDPNRPADSDAVQLFAERAREANRNFALNGENLAEVVEICRRVHGNPLSIEIAAARSATWSPATLLAAWDELDIEESLEATMLWTVELLPPFEQALFRRLSIFSSPISLDAALAVAADPGSNHRKTLKALETLTESQLLQMGKPIFENRTVFELVGPARSLARKLLDETSEAEVVGRRHSQWIASGAPTRADLQGPDQDIWLERAAGLYPDIKAAALREIGAGNEHLAGEIIANFGPLWIRRFDLDIQPFVEPFRQKFADSTSDDMINVLNLAGMAHDYRGDFAAARAAFLTLIARARGTGSPLLGSGITNYARMLRAHGHLKKAMRLVRRAIRLLQPERPVRERIGAQFGLVSMCLDMGELEQAKEVLQQLTQLMRPLKDKFLELYLHGVYATYYAATEEFDKCEESTLASARIAMHHGYDAELAALLIRMSELEMRRGHPENAFRIVTAIRGACSRRDLALEMADLRRIERLYTEAREAAGHLSEFAEEWSKIPLSNIIGKWYHI
jgi:predicted ATPase